MSTRTHNRPAPATISRRDHEREVTALKRRIESLERDLARAQEEARWYAQLVNDLGQRDNDKARYDRITRRLVACMLLLALAAVALLALAAWLPGVA